MLLNERNSQWFSEEYALSVKKPYIEYRILNAIKFPSLIEEHALSKEIHIPEEIYSLINFKRPS